MSTSQQRTTIEWLISLATIIALSLSSWSLLTTHGHAVRIAALESHLNDELKRLDEKFDTMVDLMKEIKVELREKRQD